MPSWPRDEAARARWITALAACPALIQRPISTTEDAAVIARSPEVIRAALRRTADGSS